MSAVRTFMPGEEPSRMHSALVCTPADSAPHRTLAMPGTKEVPTVSQRRLFCKLCL